jgi:hypothetical protein
VAFCVAFAAVQRNTTDRTEHGADNKQLKRLKGPSRSERFLSPDEVFNVALHPAVHLVQSHSGGVRRRL